MYVPGSNWKKKIKLVKSIFGENMSIPLNIFQNFQKIEMIKYIFGNKISEVLRMTLMIFKFHLGKTY